MLTSGRTLLEDMALQPVLGANDTQGFVAAWRHATVRQAVVQQVGLAFYNTTAAQLALFDAQAQLQVATVHRALAKLTLSFFFRLTVTAVKSARRKMLKIRVAIPDQRSKTPAMHPSVVLALVAVAHLAHAGKHMHR